MLRIPRLLWSTLGDYYYEILPFTAINLMWIVCLFGLPLIGGTAVRYLSLAGLPIFLASLAAIPPGFAGVFYAGRQFADGANIGPRDFMVGFRTYFWRAWKLAAVDLLIGALIFGNFWFYLTRDTSALKLIALPFVYLIIFWLAAQPYLFGLLMFQRDKRLVTTLRNASLLVLANIGFSLGQLLLAAIFLVLSIGLGLPFLAFTAIVGAVWFTRTLDLLLAKYPGAQREEAPAHPPRSDSAGPSLTTGAARRGT